VTGNESDSRPRRLDLTSWAPGVSLLILAALLRFYRLDAQLWLDEIAALAQLRRPFLEVVTKFPGFFPHPLYELLGHTSLALLGESAFAIRLPAALFGVAGVLMFYRLVHRLFGRGEALLAGTLLAVSYHHIFFSQDARGYTAFLFLALAATDLLLTLLGALQWRTALAYAGVAALTVYAHPFGLFVPIGQMLVALPVVWSRRREHAGTGPAPGHLVGVAALTGFIVLLLYAPFVRDSIAYIVTSRTVGGPRVFDLLPELLEGLRAAFHGYPGLALATIVGMIGILDSIRRQPIAMGLLLSPLLVGAVAVGILGMAVLHPRYFLLALPVGYLAGTRGLVVVAREVLKRGLGPFSIHIAWVQAALAVLIVALAVVPLRQYYATPKQDFLGALREVRTLAGDDRVVAAQLAGYGIRDYYAREFPIVNTLPDLLQEEARWRRIWVITTLERILAESQPGLSEHLRRNYRLVRVLPGTVGDGAMRIYVRETAGP